ncbi:thiol-disulfide oxidoreductase DCC family protein [Myxococcus sp. Y35]|uniref:thiol-disulfide oxidoreductase DCC family protein n=1 Tax=Pseudomyxococcus flavus TaxID=3115648 RepID=UPI003CEFE0D0
MGSVLHTTPPGHDVILYDGHCRLCSGAARRLQRMLGASGTRLRSFRDEGVLAAFPGVTADRCERAMQLVLPEGRVVEGLEAVVLALGRRPLGRLLRVYYLPGLRQLLDVLYRLVARYRFRIAGRQCPDGACALHFK